MNRPGRKSTSDRGKKAPPPLGQPHPKTSGETSGVGPGLILQDHGGSLLAGGQPGHKGAGGRPPNELREAARAGLDAGALARLIAIANGTHQRKGRCLTCGEYIAQEEPTNKESTAATAELIRLGVGTKIEMETPASPLLVTVTVGPEVAAERGA
jgi:hypothetical protein